MRVSGTGAVRPDAIRAPTEVELARVFAALPDCYVVLSAALEVLVASDEYMTVTRTTPEEILGRRLFDVFPSHLGSSEDTAANLLASLERVRRDRVRDTTAVWRYEIRLPSSPVGEYEERFWSAVNTPVFDENGSLRWIIHQIEDMTEFIRLVHEDAQRTGAFEQRFARMETEIIARGKELERSNRRLVEADRAKSDFLSRMSHELRTPLNSILGFSQLLSRELDDAESLDSVEHIIAAGRHLLELIDEVLDIAKIESQHLDLAPEPIALDEVVREAVELMIPLALGRAVRIEAPTPRAGFVRADRGRLRQVLLNLLSNAVKYNREGGSVVVGTRNVGVDRLRIAVSDTGPGIAPELFDRVFTPFERLGAEKTQIEGTGIGLALSKRLTEAMGGSIGFTSELGAGSTFFVDLERAPSPIAARAAQPAPQREPRTRRIGASVLYIEDNLANRLLVERILGGLGGVDLRCAPEGRLGIELARARPPDLVLLDLHLPDVRGEEVARALRDDPRTARVPIVVLSADARSSHSDELLALGVRRFLAKPLDIAELEDVVDAVISGEIEIGP